MPTMFPYISAEVNPLLMLNQPVHTYQVDIKVSTARARKSNSYNISTGRTNAQDHADYSFSAVTQKLNSGPANMGFRHSLTHSLISVCLRERGRRKVVLSYLSGMGGVENGTPEGTFVRLNGVYEKRVHLITEDKHSAFI